jgi:1-acyl-sn-glycerol-3-phosphate acyltransferase
MLLVLTSAENFLPLGTVLASFRLLIFSAISLVVTLVLFIGGLFRLPHAFSFGVFAGAVRLIRFFLGIKVTYFGKAPASQGIIMCNHRSYIDVVLIPSIVPYVVVAKKQVRAWPVIGWVGRALKVIFVDRDSVESRRATRAAIKDRLETGMSVLIFPEGTTHRGPDILPFKQGMFTTCAESGFSITPVALEYANPDMAWIGTDTFLPHFMRTFCYRQVRVAVSFGAPASGGDGEALRKGVEDWVGGEVMKLRNKWDG